MIIIYQEKNWLDKRGILIKKNDTPFGFSNSEHIAPLVYKIIKA